MPAPSSAPTQIRCPEIRRPPHRAAGCPPHSSSPLPQIRRASDGGTPFLRSGKPAAVAPSPTLSLRSREPKAAQAVASAAGVLTGGGSRVQARAAVFLPRGIPARPHLQGERAGAWRPDLPLGRARRRRRPPPVAPCLLLSPSLSRGPWAGTACENGHASRAGPTRKSAHSAVPGPEARHEARSGTAREARRAVPARHPPGRALPMPGPCRTGPARWPSICQTFDVTGILEPLQ